MSSPFLNEVARRILSCHAQDLPDLRRAVVIVPNYHVAQPLAQALSAAAGLPALLLPPMLTLGDWANSVQLETPVISDTRRIAALYSALRERRWFGDADLWSLSRELLGLMDELTRHHVALPLDEAEFAAQLAQAYQARSGEALQFEARVVHELWYAMAAAGAELDGVRAYQQRLAQLAGQVSEPLYVLLTSELSAPELRFIAACRERVAVELFDLREMALGHSDQALLCSALQRTASSGDLRSDAARLASQADAALATRLQLFAAHGLEHEAQAADVQVRRWLLEGKQSIAVVVQDRLAARRVRALLERAQVQVQDETGWTFATLSVSTVLMRWLDALQNDFYYLDVLDLFKSPLLFADGAPAARKQAAYQFEQMVRKQGVTTNLQAYIEVAERTMPDLVQPLVRLRQAAQLLPKKNAALVEWLQALQRSLDVLGVLRGWSQDAAGQQLLQLLSQWQDELRGDVDPHHPHLNPDETISHSTRLPKDSSQIAGYPPEGEEANARSPASGAGKEKYSYAEWKRWLAQQMDLNTFRDLSVDSPVLFTHLAATRWRHFDAVLLLGCDATHLPAPVNAGQWFNDTVRAALGLPLSGAQQLQVRDDLLGLLALNRNVLVTWQDRHNGEPNLLSPYLEMLRALHVLAYRDDLAERDLGNMLEGAQVRVEDAERLPASGEAGSTMPRPAVPAALLPARISPSAYNSLVACPYQFYARHVLRLNDLDEVREELDKRDYGTWVHELLQRFHDEYPLLTSHAREQLAAELQRISREVFADALAHDYLAQAWLLRWQALIPAYLDWQLENEQAGWRYQASEQPFAVEVDGGLTLRGRLDRIDSRVDDAGKLCVLDYKTQAVAALKNKLKDAGEDVQLACYAHVRAAHDAAFVSLEGGKVLAVSPMHDVQELARLNIARLAALFAQMRASTALPANGVDAVCAYCEMKGLCRRGDWESANG